MMLGATRPIVTAVAETLQKAGLITYDRGHVTIVDREKLEDASSECYRARVGYHHESQAAAGIRHRLVAHLIPREFHDAATTLATSTIHPRGLGRWATRGR